jgi:signal peptidase II
VAFIVASLVFLLDQYTKFLATQKLVLNQPLPAIKGVLYFTLVRNRGAAFGVLKNQIILFIFTSVFAIILICLNLKNNKRPSYIIYLSLILGGALGNLIDRLFLGYVVDFLDFRIWPVFNIADSAITIGAILLGWSILKSKNNSLQLPAEGGTPDDPIRRGA